METQTRADSQRHDHDQLPTNRGKYKKFTTEEKIAIVQEAEIDGVRVISRKYKLSHSTVISWMKIDLESSELTPGGRKPGSGRLVTYPAELEQNIVKWVLEQRKQQILVSMNDVCSYAHSVVSPVLPDFKASKGWCARFMKRQGLALRQLPAARKTKITASGATELQKDSAETIIMECGHCDYKIRSLEEYNDHMKKHDVTYDETEDKTEKDESHSESDNVSVDTLDCESAQVEKTQGNRNNTSVTQALKRSPPKRFKKLQDSPQKGASIEERVKHKATRSKSSLLPDDMKDVLKIQFEENRASLQCHRDIMFCSQCLFWTDHWQDMKSHQICHHFDEEHFVCKLCKYMAMDNTLGVAHMLMYHEAISSDWSWDVLHCEHCEAYLMDYVSWLLHCFIAHKDAAMINSLLERYVGEDFKPEQLNLEVLKSIFAYAHKVKMLNYKPCKKKKLSCVLTVDKCPDKVKSTAKDAGNDKKTHMADRRRKKLKVSTKCQQRDVKVKSNIPTERIKNTTEEVKLNVQNRKMTLQEYLEQKKTHTLKRQTAYSLWILENKRLLVNAKLHGKCKEFFGSKKKLHSYTWASLSFDERQLWASAAREINMKISSEKHPTGKPGHQETCSKSKRTRKPPKSLADYVIENAYEKSLEDSMVNAVLKSSEKESKECVQEVKNPAISVYLDYDVEEERSVEVNDRSVMDHDKDIKNPSLIDNATFEKVDSEMSQGLMFDNFLEDESPVLNIKEEPVFSTEMINPDRTEDMSMTTIEESPEIVDHINIKVEQGVNEVIGYDIQGSRYDNQDVDMNSQVHMSSDLFNDSNSDSDGRHCYDGDLGRESRQTCDEAYGGIKIKLEHCEDPNADAVFNTTEDIAGLQMSASVEYHTDDDMFYYGDDSNMIYDIANQPSEPNDESISNLVIENCFTLDNNEMQQFESDDDDKDTVSVDEEDCQFIDFSSDTESTNVDRSSGLEALWNESSSSNMASAEFIDAQSKQQMDQNIGDKSCDNESENMCNISPCWYGANDMAKVGASPNRLSCPKFPNSFLVINVQGDKEYFVCLLCQNVTSASLYAHALKCIAGKDRCVKLTYRKYTSLHRCALCGFFGSKLRVKEHVTQSLLYKFKPYVCITCNARFPTHAQVKQHCHGKFTHLGVRHNWRSQIRQIKMLLRISSSFVLQLFYSRSPKGVEEDKIDIVALEQLITKKCLQSDRCDEKSVSESAASLRSLDDSLLEKQIHSYRAFNMEHKQCFHCLHCQNVVYRDLHSHSRQCPAKGLTLLPTGDHTLSYVCVLCSASSQEMDSVIQHVIEVHSNVFTHVRPFSCINCDADFFTRKLAVWHCQMKYNETGKVHLWVSDETLEQNLKSLAAQKILKIWKQRQDTG